MTLFVTPRLPGGLWRGLVFQGSQGSVVRIRKKIIDCFASVSSLRLSLKSPPQSQVSASVSSLRLSLRLSLRCVGVKKNGVWVSKKTVCGCQKKRCVGVKKTVCGCQKNGVWVSKKTVCGCQKNGVWGVKKNGVWVSKKRCQKNGVKKNGVWVSKKRCVGVQKTVFF